MMGFITTPYFLWKKAAMMPSQVLSLIDSIYWYEYATPTKKTFATFWKLIMECQTFTNIASECPSFDYKPMTGHFKTDARCVGVGLRSQRPLFSCTMSFVFFPPTPLVCAHLKILYMHCHWTKVQKQLTLIQIGKCRERTDVPLRSSMLLLCISNINNFSINFQISNYWPAEETILSPDSLLLQPSVHFPYNITPWLKDNSSITELIYDFNLTKQMLIYLR